MKAHDFLSNQSAPHEGYAPVENAKLYFREAGQGPPVIVIHGGPDFDHTYLLPDLDRLSDSYRLIYYDQRGAASLQVLYGLKMSVFIQMSKM